MVTVLVTAVRVTVTVWSVIRRPPSWSSAAVASACPAGGVPPTTRVVCRAWSAAAWAMRKPAPQAKNCTKSVTIRISPGTARANSTATEPRSSRRRAGRWGRGRWRAMRGRLLAEGENPAGDDFAEVGLERGEDDEDGRGTQADTDGVLDGVAATLRVGAQLAQPRIQRGGYPLGEDGWTGCHGVVPPVRLVSAGQGWMAARAG